MILQVGVKILLQNEQNEFLFLQRANALTANSQVLWDIPGGRINSEESLLSALERELTEEIGVVLANEPTLLMAQDIFVTDKELHVVRLTYYAHVTNEEMLAISLSDEHQAFCWRTAGNSNDLVIDPYVLQVLNKHQDWKVSNNA